MYALIALLAALIPWNPVEIVTTNHVDDARNRWLVVVLGLGVIWLALSGVYWLALMGLWFLLQWPQKGADLLEHLVSWSAIGATWFFLRMIPGWAWDYIAWGWVAGAIWQSWLCVQAYKEIEWPSDNRPRFGNRTKGSYGSPVLTGIALAAAFPFVTWWLLPLLLPGVYLTFSYTCLLGISLAAAWMWPTTALWVFGGLSASLGTMLLAKCHEVDVVGKATWRNQRLFEWTPRGDSVDGWWARVVVDRLVLAKLWRERPWMGFGPGSLDPEIRRWSSQTAMELPSGELHCDPLQHCYEYGLIGLAAITAFVIPIALNLRLGDPFSAAWVTLAVISLLHWPLRHPSLSLMFLAISARLA